MESDTDSGSDVDGVLFQVGRTVTTAPPPHVRPTSKQPTNVQENAILECFEHAIASSNSPAACENNYYEPWDPPARLEFENDNDDDDDDNRATATVLDLSQWKPAELALPAWAVKVVDSSIPKSQERESEQFTSPP